VAWGAEEPIRIGYLATLTGEGSTWGQHEQDGAVMAVEEINAAGGLLGRKVELVIYDVKGRAEDAINAARRLVTQDKVVAIGGTNYSSLNIAARPIIQEAQVPMIGSATTNPVVTVNPDTNEPWPYSFRICFTDPYQGLVMASYLYQKLGLKTAAIIGDVGSDYSEGMKQYSSRPSRNWAEPSPFLGIPWWWMWTSVPSSRRSRRRHPRHWPCRIFTRKWRSPSSRRRNWISIQFSLAVTATVRTCTRSRGRHGRILVGLPLRL
jgi:hypothetical protein